MKLKWMVTLIGAYLGGNNLRYRNNQITFNDQK